jgi:hypothetical protein
MSARLILAACFVALALTGCGGSGLRDTCNSIEWKGRQCEALKRVDWAKAHNIPPNTVEGYYSLPESER